MAHKSLSEFEAFGFPAHEVTPVPSRAVTADVETGPSAANRAPSSSTTSPADLALDLVLGEMLQQARLASSATGAAVGLLHGSQIVCRAAAGATATEIAAYLAMDCKIVDVCLRSGNAQRSDDTETDPRFNAAACKRLGLRSVVVVPVKNKDEKSVGVVEIFASRPSAFCDRDVLMLEGIGHRVLHNMEIARQVMAAGVAPAVPPVPSTNPRPRMAQLPKRIHVPNSLRFWERPLGSFRKPAFDSRLFLLLSAIVLSLTLGWMLGRVHSSSARKRVTRVAASSQSLTSPSPNSEPVAKAENSAVPSAVSRSQEAAPVPSPTQAINTPSADDDSMPGITITRHVVAKHKVSQPSVPVATDAPDDDAAGSLVVFEDTTKEKPETFVASEAHAVVQKASKTEPAHHTATTIRVSPAEAEKNLIQRVEPDYPQEARAQNLQGKVILDIIVDKTGAVRGISKLSGDPQLTLASARAVQQWRFKPLTRDGSPIQFETRVTLNFSVR